MAPIASLNVQYLPVGSIRPNAKNPRKHSKQQIAQIAKSIEQFGFNVPLLVDHDNLVIAGHGRLLAAQQLGMAELPIIRLAHLSEAQVRAFMIADNRLCELAEWDDDLLGEHFRFLSGLELDFDLDITGFEMPRIDCLLQAGNAPEPEAPCPMPEKRAVSQLGDLWLLGAHRIFCGDAREAHSYHRLLGEERVRQIFTDPPYNVAVQGHVTSNDAHREFAMASGEMTPAQFTELLRTVITHLIHFSVDGSMHYLFMDWRHLREMLDAGAAYHELKNLVVWNKANGGMGGLYRSKHELVFVYKNGTARHVNNIELGKHGRNRCNVWDYAGQTSFHADRDQTLALHPTVKPVALTVDALLDCSNRGDLVLDPFGGSGTTLIAAEEVGRHARLIEIDPLYVDVTVRRWQQLTGQTAVHAVTNQPFDARVNERAGE